MINVVDWKIENESILEKKWKKKKRKKSRKQIGQLVEKLRWF